MAEKQRKANSRSAFAQDFSFTQAVTGTVHIEGLGRFASRYLHLDITSVRPATRPFLLNVTFYNRIYETETSLEGTCQD